MRQLGFFLIACAVACFGAIFAYWASSIWTGDARYGYTAGMFIIPTIVFVILGGILVDE